MKKILLIEGIEVGELIYTGGDMFWSTGKFKPYSIFDSLGIKFKEYEELSYLVNNDDISESEYVRLSDNLLNLQDELNKMNISMKERESESSLKNLDFKIIDGYFEHKQIKAFFNLIKNKHFLGLF